MVPRLALAVAVVLATAGSSEAQWCVTREAKLTASNGQANSNFGWSVSIDGDTAAAGASGSVYVLVRNGTTWTEQAELSGFGGFGDAVSLSGDTLVVGAPFAQGTRGRAFIFTRSGTSWTKQAKLKAGDPVPGDRFGNAVSVDGLRAVVGAFEKTHTGHPMAGAAYVFVRTGTTWSQEARIRATYVADHDRFGSSVGIDGDTIVVGVPWRDGGFFLSAGIACVFERSSGGWVQRAKLSRKKAALHDYDIFGWSADVQGDTILIGTPAWFHSEGSAFVFARSGTVWSQEKRLKASDGQDRDQFGSSVSLSGDTAVVGADRDDHSGGTNAGSAYVFARTGTSWSEQVKLIGKNPKGFDNFGLSASISGGTAVVGAPLDDTLQGANSGTVEVFRFSTQAPTRYCTAGTSASGCTATIGATGTPSATASTGFLLTAMGLEGNRGGMFFYGNNGRQTSPWGKGTSLQCVKPPVKRAGQLAGTGTNGQCDGLFTQDLNALWSAVPAKNPGVGATVQAQLWYHDPLNTSNRTTSLSDAIELTVCP